MLGFMLRVRVGVRVRVSVRVETAAAFDLIAGPQVRSARPQSAFNPWPFSTHLLFYLHWTQPDILFVNILFL